MREWFDKAFGVAAQAISTAAEDGHSRLITEGWFGRNVPEARSSDPLGRTLPEQPERDVTRGLNPDRSPDHSRDHNRGVDLDR